MGNPGRVTRGEGLLSSGPSPGRWVPHPTRVLCVWDRAVGETRVSPKTLQNVKQLRVACVWGPCCQQLAVPHTAPRLLVKGQCVPHAFLGGDSVPAQAPQPLGEHHSSPTASWSSLWVTSFISLPPPQPHTASCSATPFRTPCKNEMEQVCLRQVQQSCIWHL